MCISACTVADPVGGYCRGQYASYEMLRQSIVNLTYAIAIQTIHAIQICLSETFPQIVSALAAGRLTNEAIHANNEIVRENVRKFINQTRSNMKEHGRKLRSGH